MKYAQMSKGSPFISQFTKVLCALALLGAFASNANAAPIVGEIAYGFILTPEDDLGNEVDLGSATFLDFYLDSAILFVATGDFSGLGGITLTDFAINPFVSPQNVWTGGGFSFDLESLAIVGQSDDFLNLRGFGYASGNGLDATLGEWTLSVDNAGGSFFSYSSTTNVPEPGTLALFGLGLVGLGTISRRRKVKNSV